MTGPECWELGRNQNVNSEQSGAFIPASLSGWDRALADGSLKTICAERAGDGWQDFQHLHKPSEEHCLSGISEAPLCAFLPLLSAHHQPGDVGGKFEANFHKMEHDN